jgi:hypothetical protein
LRNIHNNPISKIGLFPFPTFFSNLWISNGDLGKVESLESKEGILGRSRESTEIKKRI